MNTLPILSLQVWVPILAGLALLGFGKPLEKGAKAFAILVSAFVFLIATFSYIRFDSNSAAMQFTEMNEWIPTLGFSYHLGVDGISIWMTILSALLGLIAVVISSPTEKQKAFFSMLLILNGTLMGVFASLDLVLFYVFFELSLIPVAVLTLFWGTGDRAKAATKYVAMLFAGSLLMLVGIIVIGMQMKGVTGSISFDLTAIQPAVASGKLWAGAAQLQSFAFLGFLIAFLFKAPAIPFHTWLADTYESAPMGAIVGGVVLKVGTYGLLRFCLPLFPDAVKQYGALVAILGAAGVVYGGIVAINQKSVQRLMAFSTVSHVGFILVGAFSFNHFGLMGASFQQFNHGIASAAVFVLLSFYYQRGGGTNLAEMGGLKRQMPIFSTLFLVAMLCNLGLPLTSGFVGEFLALLGSFQSGMSGLYGLKVVVAAVAGLGAIFSAAYMLYMFQRMFYGEAIDQREYKDINMREMALAGIFSFIILGLGIYPTPVLKAMEPTVLSLKNSVFPATDVTMVEMPKSSDKPRLSLTGGR